MKTVIVSNPNPVKNEADTANALFDEGLQLFHLRKPDYSEKELIEYLKKINSKHHSKIVLHEHHSLAETFGINRIHFSESERLKTTEVDFKKKKKMHFILSTSIHCLSNHELLPDSFSYTFFGPVFESISKKGYKPKSNKLVQLSKNKNRKIKIIAIGGITPDKIVKIEEANFDGVALLGAIWTDTKNAIKNFKECNQSVIM